MLGWEWSAGAARRAIKSSVMCNPKLQHPASIDMKELHTFLNIACLKCLIGFFLLLFSNPKLLLDLRAERLGDFFSRHL